MLSDAGEGLGRFEGHHLNVHSWLVPKVVFPVYERLTGRRPWSEARRLSELQWHSAEELQTRSMGRLRPLLVHAAANVPYYADLFAQAGVVPEDIRSISDLNLLPVTRKQDLRASFPNRTLANNLPRRRRYKLRTAGSSGTPLEFYADRAELDAWMGSFLFFIHQWSGASLWSTRIRISGSTERRLDVTGPPRLVESARALLLGDRRIHLAGPEITAHELRATVGRLVGREYYIWAYSSYATHLGTGLLENGLDLAAYPKVVIASAETLSPMNQATIERAFRCPVVNHYTCWEIPQLAQSCPDNPQLMHVNTERAILRVVRDDGTLACPGESGRVIVTHLGNWVMPFINYELGDRATPGPACPCGRGFPTLQHLDGRSDEVIRTVDGRIISPTAFNNILTVRYPVAGKIAEFQAVQTATDELTVFLVPLAPLSSELLAEVRANVETVVGPGMNVQTEVVDRIEPDASGKRLIIKSLLP